MKRYVYKYVLVTLVYCLAVGTLFFYLFSSNGKPVATPKRHVPLHPTAQVLPNAPVFSRNQYKPVDRTTSIHVDKRSMGTFNAYIMTVSDPKKISIVTTNDLWNSGQTVEEIVRSYNAIAGINGGSFADPFWQGNGGQVEGTTISDGKVIINSPRIQNIVGFTSQGHLISGAYSVGDLKRMNVVQALTFGPTLVENGVGIIQGNGDWGYAPRTAIGQRSDGTVIMIVTDGRGLTGGNDIGASLRDIQNLMLQYGAVIAANLDGGSSATMIYRGDLVNQPTDILGQRKVGTALIVR